MDIVAALVFTLMVFTIIALWMVNVRSNRMVVDLGEELAIEQLNRVEDFDEWAERCADLQYRIDELEEYIEELEGRLSGEEVKQ